MRRYGRKLTLLVLALTAFSLTSANREFTVALLPDTQHYSEDSPGTYKRQTEWIANNKATENIKFAIHLGDVTQNNTPIQWLRARAAHDILDAARVPYSVVPGNHDYIRDASGNISRSTNLFNEWFGPQRFIGGTSYGGALGGRNDNNFMFFESEDLKFMVVFVVSEKVTQTLQKAFVVKDLLRGPRHRIPTPNGLSSSPIPDQEA